MTSPSAMAATLKYGKLTKLAFEEVEVTIQCNHYPPGEMFIELFIEQDEVMLDLDCVDEENMIIELDYDKATKDLVLILHPGLVLDDDIPQIIKEFEEEIIDHIPGRYLIKNCPKFLYLAIKALKPKAPLEFPKELVGYP